MIRIIATSLAVLAGLALQSLDTGAQAAVPDRPAYCDTQHS